MDCQLKKKHIDYKLFWDNGLGILIVFSGLIINQAKNIKDKSAPSYIWISEIIFSVRI